MKRRTAGLVVRGVIGGLTLIVIAAQAQVQPNAWTPRLSMQVRSIGAVVPSPDGRLAVYTQNHVSLDPEKSRWIAQLFLARADGSSRIQLTQDESGASSPAFSPDGRRVYFLSDRSGKTKLWSFTGTTDILSFMPYYLSGEAWDRLPVYLEHSPMYYVKGVTTPTLILHGEADLRVPISQSYELYNALKRHGVTTQMVVYPGMPHGPNNPAQRLDIMERHFEWVERCLR